MWRGLVLNKTGELRGYKVALGSARCLHIVAAYQAFSTFPPKSPVAKDSSTWSCQYLGPCLVPHPNLNWLSIALPLLDWGCQFLSLELSIQPSLNAILIPPHLRSPSGPATLSSSSQALTETQTGQDWQAPDATATLTNSS